MDTNLIPPHDFFGIPAPTWVFVVLMNLTLALHFIAMGYVFTATLMQIFFQMRAKPGNAYDWLVKRTEAPLPVALSLTITLGVAPLLFVQVLYGPYFYTSNILIGYQWFGMVPMLMIGFYLIYLIYGNRFMKRQIPKGLAVLGRLVIFLCVLYMAVTHTINAILTITPDVWRTVREAGGNPSALINNYFFARLLHNLFAAQVIGCVWFLALGMRSLRVESDEIARAGATKLKNLGTRMGLGLICVQIVVGLWLLFAEIPSARQALLMPNRPASMLWWLAGLGILGLLVVMTMAMTLEKPGKLIFGAWGALFVTLGGMFAGRQLVREMHLADYMTLKELELNPQISSLLFFLITFVIGLVVLGFMIRWMLDTAKRPIEESEEA